MRVGIIALQHESNTFLQQPTVLADFQREVLLRGAKVQRHYGGGHHEVSGFFKGLGEEGIEAVGIFGAMANPGGAVTGETYESLRRTMWEGLEEAGNLDGILVAPHGAGVSETARDMDGDWLSELRTRAGAQMPIMGTIDPHANLSQRMVRACNALIPYRTNPHVDQLARGIEAARLMARTLSGEVNPKMAAAFPPMAINIACQHTESPPCRGLMALAQQQREQTGVLSCGVVLGFPYADVEEMGSSFIVVADGDQALAEARASELSQHLMRQRHDFVPRLAGVDEAVDQLAGAQPPVCLLDLGDNVGGGSPGDGTFIATALQRRDIPACLVCLCDPAVAGAAATSGAGSTFEGFVGGKTDRMHGPPLHVKGRVRSVHDGVFGEREVRHGGRSHFDMGKTVVIEAAHLTLLVHSIRTPPFSLNQIISCGLDVQNFRVVVAKGVNAPLAAYAPVCRTFIQVDTPGVTTAAMTRLPFQRRRRPLFPFEDMPGPQT